MQSIRVLTWNLWWRFGDWRRRFEAISAVLDKVQPDICCFQEVWSSTTEDAADHLGQSHGLDHVARSYSDEPERWQRQTGDTDIDYGNAIVSRWPLLETDVRRLPGPHGRTSLSAVVGTPAGALPMLCTHLSAHPAASAERCDQVRAVVEHVASVGARDFPPVVAGDFNAEPDSDEIRLLSGTKTAPVVPDLYLVDAWRFADDGDPGWTWRRDNQHIPAAYGMSARIDYLHVGQPVEGRGLVRRVDVAGIGPEGGIWPSDHVAVVADLSV